MASDIDDETFDIPKYFYDYTRSKVYNSQRFLGKGTFAKCYEIFDIETGDIFAGKIFFNKLMKAHNHLKEKITQEVALHRSLNHPNIVKFHGYFMDELNTCILLELCQQNTMNELHNRRQTITEHECRYYMYQIINGVKYLHQNHIIHRDLKLSNLFLNDSLHVKIGNFGVATCIEYQGERKNTLCGTLNFIAPEILTEKGHSYEADIWSIGCVMYTLLVGEPPFATNTIKETCEKIKKCKYLIPNVLSKSAADMITAMLQLNPEHRPTIAELLSFDFLSSDSVPKFLPISCLTMAPRMEHNDTMENDDAIAAAANAGALRNDIRTLQQQFANLFNAKPPLLSGNLDRENTDPAARPLYWIIKWLDYSDKYGFGYQLCDGSTGVLFNDNTKIILLPNQINVHYIDEEGRESYMTTGDNSEVLKKKLILLSHFKRIMIEKLAWDEVNNVDVDFVSDEISRMPNLHSWYRTKCAAIFQLTNGTVQLNFDDYVKIILCPRMSAVTYIDYKKKSHTYRFSTILQHGWSMDLFQKIRYAHEAIGKLP